MRYLIPVVLFVGFAVEQAVAQYTVIGQSQPVAGITSDERLSYINPDATYMLVTVGTFPDFYTASRTWDPIAGAWGDLVQLLPGNSSAAYLSPDGNTLYYQRPIGSVSELFRSTWNGSSWADEQNIESLLPYGNAPVVNETTLVLDGPNSSDSEDIFTADITGDWFSSPVPVTTVNTTHRDCAPWLSLDGRNLLFQSDQPGGYGGFDEWDLYQATWDDALGTWTNPTNLGPNVNTNSDEIWPRVAEVAGKLFFTQADATYSHFCVMEVTVTPEPSTCVLLAIGGFGLLAVAWRRRKRAA